jgi:predicted MFS family arabinose efflux permease
MSWRSQILILPAGTFVIGTDAFVVAGVLPSLTAQLNVSTAVAGQLISVFAITYAIASPVLGALTSHWERRRLLLVALGVFAAGNLLAANTPNYSIMLIARVVSGAGAAMFTPGAAATAAMLVPAEARGRALAQVAAGITIATVIGVPLVTLFGNEIGFRAAFWAITAAAVLAGIVIRIVLPTVVVPGGTTLRQRIDITRLPGVPSTLLVSTCAFVGGFTVYNYIAPLFTERLGVGPSSITWLLLAFGVGGAIGNFIGGETADRVGAYPVVAVGLILASAGLLLIALFGDTWIGAVTAVVLWGIGGWLQVPAQQHRLVELAGPAAPLAISLNSSAMYLGISLAGAIGGFISEAASLDWLAPFGAAMGLLGLTITILLYPKSTKRTTAARIKAG